ncbi:MAG: 4a-hydroxytetrahydrobiopterin dehydratase [Alicyclobacillus sp.]|nr:4a-hydroxytetrahydrobiopterin dehydratase [Alicyclobacillus sp.]
MSERLTEEQVAEALTRLPNWKLEGKQIYRRYAFPSFPAAIAFVNQVAQLAESWNHHPFIQIDFKYVVLRLTSWHAGGLTMKDFDEAQAFDAVYDETWPS